VSESGGVRARRRKWGRRLATARKDAGYAQREFARRINYARSTLSTVESGVQRAGRVFWETCDDVLGTGGEFAHGYDRIRTRLAAERQDAAGRVSAPEHAGEGLRATTVCGALRAYQELGWPVVVDGDVAELVTGSVLDALEVPRAAGTLAACWWLCSGGAADEIRGLPMLPDPRQALAVIACGDRFFFLAAAGSCPWAGQDLSADLPGAVDAPVVGWHSGGSRIPAPPTGAWDGQHAAWAYLPSRGIELACPVMLLDLLAKAVAAAQSQQALTLPGGVLAVPILGGVHDGTASVSPGGVSRPGLPECKL
jgi:transcriptional regulator with XRE-family HTH domain